MHKPLAHIPVFVPDTLVAKSESWRGRTTVPGSDRIVVEWTIAQGPSVFVYPANERIHGIQLVDDGIKRLNEERWADYLEFDYVPKVADALSTGGFRPQIICVDQRPILIQRERRRQWDNVGKAKTGIAPSDAPMEEPDQTIH